MRTYAAGYWQTLLKLRLPAALPFIFNALKINSTLALIGAIVAEFFGTPIVGMGFRISTEVGRMGIDMVWAEIAVAALAGSIFYGLVSLIERAVDVLAPVVPDVTSLKNMRNPNGGVNEEEFFLARSPWRRRSASARPSRPTR